MRLNKRVSCMRVFLPFFYEALIICPIIPSSARTQSTVPAPTCPPKKEAIFEEVHSVTHFLTG